MNAPAVVGGLLALLLAGGCEPHPFSRPYAVYGNTSADSLRGQCERSIFDDPAVKEQLGKSTAIVSNNSAEAFARLDIVKQQALQRCMYRLGGPQQGGGVELPR